ncbi:MAG: hypothetical protein WDW36_003376 [Sanguina aurantia]
MALVTLIARPVLSSLHDLLVNQAIVPSRAEQPHPLAEPYVIRQSLGFFQNDYAGRIANRIMQTGASLRESAVQIVDALWYVTIYTGSAIVLFARRQPWLCWRCRWWPYGAGDPGRDVADHDRASSSARGWHRKRSRRTGWRIVDAIANVLNAPLFASTRRGRTWKAVDAMGEQTSMLRQMTRQTTAMDASITILNDG